ncbi:MAG: DUF3419 family protein [Pseudomonadota bacterium]
MSISTAPGRATTPDPNLDRLGAAVQGRANSALSREGLLERLFTYLFRGLVYPQIWEDPVVDMKALRLGPGKRMITIASGGCNVMSYLTADPAEVLAVDLNKTHVALNKLKIAAARNLPNYQAFYRFFGDARHPENVRAYDLYVRDWLDQETRHYWDGRDALLRRRITFFRRGLYRRGLLGNFIGYGHLGATLFGVRLAKAVECRTLEEQRAFFDGQLAPVFESGLVRWLTGHKASLFGLGIPPAQYDSLKQEGGGDMALVLKRRLEKLLCDFPIEENYFAWQAFARSYGPGGAGPVPPYLEAAQFEAVRERALRVSVRNLSVTERLREEPDAALDGYVLLDAQDWMTDEQLNALWDEITRTAKPGARVIFRTADLPSLLPGRVAAETLAQWRYEAEESAEHLKNDRSAIYGGFHLYVKRGAENERADAAADMTAPETDA